MNAETGTMILSLGVALASIFMLMLGLCRAAGLEVPAPEEDEEEEIDPSPAPAPPPPPKMVGEMSLDVARLVLGGYLEQWICHAWPCFESEVVGTRHNAWAFFNWANGQVLEVEGRHWLVVVERGVEQRWMRFRQIGPRSGLGPVPLPANANANAREDRA